MSPSDYQRLRRRLLREGQTDDGFWEELRGVARRMVRRRALPPAYSPYGEWNPEAEAEIFQSWATERLVGQGQLRALVAQAADLSAFRSLGEISLRQHLINRTQRTQSQNLYARFRRLLEDDEGFRCVIQSDRPSRRWYGLAEWDDAQPFSGDERRLRAAAWSVGPLNVVRYRADSKKLSPVLDAAELRRFSHGTFESLSELLTVGLLLRGLQLRIDLDPPSVESLDDDTPVTGHSRSEIDLLTARELAVGAIAEFTRRQVEVLVGTDQGRTLDQMAAALRCSRGTVLNEQQRAGSVLARLSSNDAERDQLLNVVLEMLYEASE